MFKSNSTDAWKPCFSIISGGVRQYFSIRFNNIITRSNYHLVTVVHRPIVSRRYSLTTKPKIESLTNFSIPVIHRIHVRISTVVNTFPSSRICSFPPFTASVQCKDIFSDSKTYPQYTDHLSIICVQEGTSFHSVMYREDEPYWER